MEGIGRLMAKFTVKLPEFMQGKAERGSWIFDRVTGELVPRAQYQAQNAPAGLQVMRDLDPYKSVVTGEVIGGRRQHRDHLRAHGVVEVGNEKPLSHRPAPLPSVGPDVKRAFEMVRSGYRPGPLGVWRDE